MASYPKHTACNYYHKSLTHGSLQAQYAGNRHLSGLHNLTILHDNQITQQSDYTKIRLHHNLFTQPFDYPTVRLHQNSITQQSVYTTIQLHNHPITPESDYTKIRLHKNLMTPKYNYTTIWLHLSRLHNLTVLHHKPITQPSGYTTIRLYDNQVTNNYTQRSDRTQHSDYYTEPSHCTILFDPFSKKKKTFIYNRRAPYLMSCFLGLS